MLAAHFGNIKNFFLGLVEQLARFAAIRCVGRIGDFLTHAREAAGDGAFTHDLGVKADIDGTRRAFGQALHVADAAHSLQFAGQLQ